MVQMWFLPLVTLFALANSQGLIHQTVYYFHQNCSEFQWGISVSIDSSVEGFPSSCSPTACSNTPPVFPTPNPGDWPLSQKTFCPVDIGYTMGIIETSNVVATTISTNADCTGDTVVRQFFNTGCLAQESGTSIQYYLYGS